MSRLRPPCWPQSPTHTHCANLAASARTEGIIRLYQGSDCMTGLGEGLSGWSEDSLLELAKEAAGGGCPQLWVRLWLGPFTSGADTGFPGKCPNYITLSWRIQSNWNCNTGCGGFFHSFPFKVPPLCWVTGGEGEGGVEFSAFVQVSKTETNKQLVRARAGLFPHVDWFLTVIL